MVRISVVKVMHVVQMFRHVAESGGKCLDYVEGGVQVDCLRCSLLLSLASRSANHFIYRH